MQKSRSKDRKRSNLSPDQVSVHLQRKSGTKKTKKNEHDKETEHEKIPTTQQIQTQCFICTSPYNLNRKLPVIACRNNHTFCFSCITLSIQSLKPNCPTCRQPMEPTSLNSQIYKEVIKIYKDKNKHLEKNLLVKKFQRLTMKTFSKKHSLVKDFQIDLRAGQIVKKKQDGESSLIVFEPEIKGKELKKFHFTYFPATAKVQISFGVCIYDKFLLKMIQNCGFDTKIIEFFMKKQQSILKVDHKKGLKIVLSVDMDKNVVHWESERESTHKEKQMQLYLVSSQPLQVNHKVGDVAFYPYCVLYNAGDRIEINK